MVNRWQGNSGKYVRVPDAETCPGRPPPPGVVGQPPRRGTPTPGALLPGSLSGLLPDALAGLETEDVILLLILYLMYRESGDSELLIIMGAMFLL